MCLRTSPWPSTGSPSFHVPAKAASPVLAPLPSLPRPGGGLHQMINTPAPGKKHTHTHPCRRGCPSWERAPPAAVHDRPVRALAGVRPAELPDPAEGLALGTQPAAFAAPRPLHGTARHEGARRGEGDGGTL